MGVKNLPTLSESLIRAGRDAHTPAALVRWGTTPEQTTLVGVLGNIAEKARQHRIKPPAILVVGEVVGMRDKLNWFENLPLFGRRVMVTRTREQASELTRALTALGAGVVECPTIRIVPPEDWAPADRAIESLSEYDWLVLTSPNGADAFFSAALVARGPTPAAWPV